MRRNVDQHLTTVCAVQITMGEPLLIPKTIKAIPYTTMIGVVLTIAWTDNSNNHDDLFFTAEGNYSDPTSITQITTEYNINLHLTTNSIENVTLQSADFCFLYTSC